MAALPQNCLYYSSDCVSRGPQCKRHEGNLAVHGRNYPAPIALSSTSILGMDWPESLRFIISGGDPAENCAVQGCKPCRPRYHFITRTIGRTPLDYPSFPLASAPTEASACAFAFQSRPLPSFCRRADTVCAMAAAVEASANCWCREGELNPQGPKPGGF